MNDFGRYLNALAGSWAVLALPHAGARVIRTDGFIASLFPDHSFLNNAVLLEPGALTDIVSLYGGAGAAPDYAVWSREGEHRLTVALQAAGFDRDITTTPMLRHLDRDMTTAAGEPQPGVPAEPAIGRVEPGVIAALNGVPIDFLDAVPGLRALATAGHDAGLVMIPVGAEVNISFVATRPASRRRGLASAVTAVALREAAGAGFGAASLQATPMAENLYARLGFRSVGRWQEWVPRREGNPPVRS